jgi:hypothetical protein
MSPFRFFSYSDIVAISSNHDMHYILFKLQEKERDEAISLREYTMQGYLVANSLSSLTTLC